MATILIAGEHRPSRQALAAALSAANHFVVEAEDGLEALAKIRAGHFDLAICDLFMPRMDGYELVRHLREDPALARVRVIFWTATYDRPITKDLAEACGVRHVLPKLAEPETVLSTVAAALAEPAAAPTPKPDFDHACVRLLVDRLAKKNKELEARRTGRAAQPILVVEDNEMDLDLMLQAFEEHNVANPLHVCRDGEEALQFIAAHLAPEDPELPLLVLLDLRLPKVDGIEVLRQARQHQVWRGIPFVVVTTSRENADIARAYELGVNSYIIKPVDFAAFSEVVKQIKMYWLLTNETPYVKPLPDGV